MLESTYHDVHYQVYEPVEEGRAPTILKRHLPSTAPIPVFLSRRMSKIFCVFSKRNGESTHHSGWTTSILGLI